MAEIKMIGIDLDGTALDSRKLISERNIEAFRRCRENSIYVVPVTGRPISGLYREYINDLSCEYAICTNGAVAFSTDNNRELIHHNLGIEKAKEITSVLDKFACHYELFNGGYGYVDRKHFEMMLRRFSGTPLRTYLMRTRKIVKSQSDLLDSVSHCDNIYVLAESSSERERIRAAIDNIKDIFYTCSAEDDVEIGGNYSKGQTLIELGNLLGIDKSEIMAIGDSGNDLNMLKSAGLAVAMENATDEIKQAADFITLSCEESGVAHAIYKFAL